METYIESVFVEVIQCDGAKELVGCIYRPPNSDFNLFFDKLSDLCNAISLNYESCRVTLSGDFNVDLLSKGNKNVTQYVSLLYSYNYLPVLLRPTRVTSTSATLLDYIWSNDLFFVKNSGIVMSNISDHFAVFCEYRGKQFYKWD